MEYRGEYSHKQPAISAAVDRIREEDFAARIRGEPGRRAELHDALIRGLKSEPGWTTVDFSAHKPYRRMLDLGKLYDFAQPGDYRVQLDYASTWLADRDQGHWVGTFSSPVFKVTIQPRD